jgi:ABC-2 type transport system permease protein
VQTTERLHALEAMRGLAFVNLAYLPLMYLSGLFFPVPQSVRWIALFSPAFHFNQLALHTAGTPSIRTRD